MIAFITGLLFRKQFFVSLFSEKKEILKKYLLFLMGMPLLSGINSLNYEWNEDVVWMLEVRCWILLPNMEIVYLLARSRSDISKTFEIQLTY